MERYTALESVTADLLGNTATGDTLSYGNATDVGVTVNLGLGTASGFTSIANIENVSGGDGNDTLTGSDGVNTLSGNDGNDTFNGGLGNDALNGEGGNDTLVGGAGGDFIDGGDGTDTADYSASDAGVNINRQADTYSGGHAQGDSLDSIENVIGSDFADTLIGNDSANVLEGRLGNDFLTGNNGSDTASYASAASGVNGFAGNTEASSKTPSAPAWTRSTASRT